MLLNLSVRNFALVQSLDIEFMPGLTVITGESGAGKSILLDALSLVLGARARRNRISSSADQCEVTAEFDIAHSRASCKFLKEQSLVDTSEPNRCVVRRVASASGRSRAWINGVATTLDGLRTLCAPLVGIHGQFESHQLLDRAAQLNWFDDFAIEDTKINEIGQLYKTWQECRQQLEDEQICLGLELTQSELLTYQVEELQDLDLHESEFENLSTEFKRYSQAQDVLQTVFASLEKIESEVQSNLSGITKAVSDIDDQHPALDEVKQTLHSVEIQLEESRYSLRTYSEALEFDEAMLEELDQRLNQIHDLARKHKVSASALFEHTQTLKNRLAQIHNSKALLETLEQQVNEAESKFNEYAQKLSKLRQSRAKDFCGAVMNALQDISLPGVTFEVDFSLTRNSRGIDAVEFLVATNPGYAAQPLSIVASGGELSRIALAILIVVAESSKLPSMILDEADVGVGGTTADVVGRVLRSLAQKNQVICVTHAPQVAALGHFHLLVSKSSEQGIKLEVLTGESRVEEIARMVGGRRVNERSRDYARTLLVEAVS